MDFLQVRRMRLENITPNLRYMLHRDNFAFFLRRNYDPKINYGDRDVFFEHERCRCLPFVFNKPFTDTASTSKQTRKI